MSFNQQVISIFWILFSLLITNCLNSTVNEGTPSANRETTTVHMALSQAALAKGQNMPAVTLDSIYIRITGDDMEARRYAFPGEHLEFDLNDLPIGLNRVITAELFRNGRMLYFGKGTYNFKKEVLSEIQLRCDPQFSRVLTQFHIPVGLPVPITNGLISLKNSTSTFTATLKKQGEFGSFVLDEIPGGVQYDVSLALADSLGRNRYEAAREKVFLPIGEEAKWDLNLLPTDARGNINIEILPIREQNLNPIFPALKRKVNKIGEVVISEFYAGPSEKDSASAGEWFELFNRSSDTLSLQGCRLARDQSIGVTRSLSFDSLVQLEPGRAYIFGRSAAKADYYYEDFTLVNTATSLVLFCDSDKLTIDSLKYSSVLDTLQALENRPLPMKEGWVTTLSADSLNNRAASESWCLTKTGGSGVGFANPGQIKNCFY